VNSGIMIKTYLFEGLYINECVPNAQGDALTRFAGKMMIRSCTRECIPALYRLKWGLEYMLIGNITWEAMCMMG